MSVSHRAMIVPCTGARATWIRSKKNDYGAKNFDKSCRFGSS